MTKKVLITGASGLIGGLLRDRLTADGGYEVTALNRSEVEGVRTVRADISDLDAIKGAFEGQDAVVHLSAVLTDADWTDMVNVNITGTYNVLEASRLAGVTRIVNASSGATIKGVVRADGVYKDLEAGRYDDVPETWDMVDQKVFHPYGLYGVSKVAGEALTRHFSDVHGLSVINLRIGMVRPSGLPEDTYDFANFLSHNDIVQALMLSLNAPADLKFDTFLVTSNNKWGYRDYSHFTDVLGYEPEDSVEDFREGKGPAPVKRAPSSGYWSTHDGLVNP
jgi:uronate dehydrogenase